MIQFEWDPAKAKMNLKKHGAAFREAATVFKDPLGITSGDGGWGLGTSMILCVSLKSIGDTCELCHGKRE